MQGFVYQFRSFTLNCSQSELCRKGRRIRLEPKPMELLALLVTRHGQLITREEIARALWQREVFVDIEHGINTAVRKIRQALDDSSDLPQFVQTVSGSGYRFIAPVQIIEANVAASSVNLENATDPQPVAQTSVPEECLAILPASGPSEPSASPTSAPTGDRFRWRQYLTIAGIVLFILGALFFSLHWLRRDNDPKIDSIAVLPLQNFSGDPAQEYFADGMTDELITKLARIPSLRVVSRTSVMAYKGSHRPLSDIARELRVDAIVEGSTVRSRDRIRVTAQLIDARTDHHLWAQAFEGSSADVLSLQDSIAQQIAAQASYVLHPPSAHAPVDPAAYDAYLRGRYFLNKQDYARCLKAFKEAVGLDPTYASALAGYASALDAATTVGIGPPKQLMPLAIDAAQRAIQLDPENGEGYTVLGSIQTIYSWDWADAEQNLTRGISLSSSDSIAEFKYAVYLDAVGRTQEAVTHMRRALQLDPLSFLMTLRLGVSLYYDRQFDAALAQLQSAAEMEPGAGSVDHWLTLIYEGLGNQDKAVEHNLKSLREDEQNIDTSTLGEAYRQGGWMGYWRAQTRAFNSPSVGLCAAAYQGGIANLRVRDLDSAFSMLNRAVDAHCFPVVFIRVEPLFDSVRNDGRYISLLKRMNQPIADD